jgi:hypothetical protein
LPFALGTFAPIVFPHFPSFQYQFDYLDALITQQSSETDAYAKFDALASDRLNELRKRHQRLEVERIKLLFITYEIF